MRNHKVLILAAGLVLALSGSAVADDNGHLEGYVPAVAHVEGKFGSFWTSDLWIYHQGATVVHLWLNKPGQDNTDGESVVVNLDESVVFIPDVVSTLFGTEGSGSVHYIADGPVTLTSRTWTPANGSWPRPTTAVSPSRWHARSPARAIRRRGPHNR